MSKQSGVIGNVVTLVPENIKLKIEICLAKLDCSFGENFTVSLQL